MINLIKRKFSRKEHLRGYTLVELLTVIAIIAIVAVIAIPASIFIKDSLAFSEKNDYAKTIYMAAQANLSEMRADGRITELQVPDNNDIGSKFVPIDDNAEFPRDHWSDEYMYCVSGSAAYDLVLPVGSVEDVLRDQKVLIEYNPYTANVYAVFYSEGSETLSYSNIARDEETRRELEMGYYCGTGLSKSKMEIVESKVIVNYINGEEGIIEVKIPIPEEFYEAPSDFANNLKTTLTIEGDGMKMPDYDNYKGEGEVSVKEDSNIPSNSLGEVVLPNSSSKIIDGRYVVYNYTVDRLVAGESFGSMAHKTSGTKLSEVKNESDFNILPGQNINVTAYAVFEAPADKVYPEISAIAPDREHGISPMFEYMIESSTSPGRYVVAVSNGRNLQNLNAMAPSIADKIETVLITDDIDWNDTVEHYKADVEKGGTSDAPLCDLPNFVPIHNEKLFGTAKFVYPSTTINSLGDLLKALLEMIEGALTGNSKGDVPTLSDELDTKIDPMTSWVDNKRKTQGVTIAENHAKILGTGGGKTIIGINIDTAKYAEHEASKYYVGDVDYSFTGLFGYVNTTITDVSMVNPVVRGSGFDYKDVKNKNGTITTYSNPATGALVGCAGYNTLLSGCRVYIDRNDPCFSAGKMIQTVPEYTSGGVQNWYGVSGEGAVGGLVGYAKSHRTTTGDLTANTEHLAFINSFAAVPVSGNMRGTDNSAKSAKNFGYSNGVGGFIGNSQLTNFYNCYASGNVRANGAYVAKTSSGGGILSSFLENIANFFGVTTDLKFSGRTSMGTGGFVGTSHGTRYTNCFATGNVDATNKHSESGVDTSVKIGLVPYFPFIEIKTVREEYDYRNLGSGGFVGLMSYDETRLYGNDENRNNIEVAQNTVFTDCYSVGRATTGIDWGENRNAYENFSGGNGRVRLSLSESQRFMGDYYELYAPLGRSPRYGNDYYIYRHSYYLSNYYLDISDEGRENTNMCASGESYDVLADLTGKHRDNAGWVTEQIEAIKALASNNGQTYGDRYFKNNGMTETYKGLYNQGFSGDIWHTATAADTHAYNVEMAGQAYPFSMLQGMPYYGDWPESPVSAGLAYYETYEAAEGEDAETVYFPLNSENVDLSDDSYVTDDGYVIFIANEEEEDKDTNTSVTVTMGGHMWDLTLEKTLPAPEGSYAHSFNIFKLPAEYLTVEPAEGEFYVEVKVTRGNTTYILYFNPDAAITQINPPDYNSMPDPADANKSIVSAAKPEKPDTVLLRSARHLANLPELNECLGDGVTYIQQLNIDASKYGTAVDTSITLDNLSGTYTGSLGYVEQAQIAGFVPESGAFFKNVSGTVTDISIILGNTAVGGEGETNAAILAGVNSGTVENVDIPSESANLKITATENVGLLIGKNEGGTVSNCDVNVWSAELSAKNVGGIIGASTGMAATDTDGAKNAAVKNCTVTLGVFNGKSAAYAGGIIGKSEDTDISGAKLTVGEGGYTATGTASGGIMGYGKLGSVTSPKVSIKSVNVASVFGGLAGDVLGVSFTNATVNIPTIEADTAAGGIGNGSSVSVNGITTVTVKTVTGKSVAAGFAGELMSSNIAAISDISVNIGDKITADELAAGFAGKMNGSINRCKVYLGKSGEDDPEIIISGKNAAGFAGTSTANAENCAVTGNGKIVGTDKAAGFTVTAESDSISGCIVTPVYGNKTSEYKNSGNDKLTVTAKSAAGFAVTNQSASLMNCVSLGTVSGTEAAAGFVLTNSGSVEKCYANTTVNGAAFIGTNNHTVRNCYAWYVGGSADSLSEGDTGAYYGCFFAPLDTENDANAVTATVFPGSGYSGADGRKSSQLTLDELSAEILNGEGNMWDPGMTYSAYYYDSELSSSPYSYPMIGTHYGDWVNMARYACGIAYFEEMADGKIYLNLVDISNSTDNPNIYGGAISFNGISYTDDNGSISYKHQEEISRAGYAVFCVDPAQMNAETGAELDESKLVLTGLNENVITADEFKKTYSLYELTSTGADEVEVSSADGMMSVSYIPAYANTINDGDNVYDIRTPEQFKNIEYKKDAAFHQRHNLDLTDEDYSVDAVKDYNGHGYTITTDKKMFGNITGTVNGITVNATGITESLIGNISADATVDTVHVSMTSAEYSTGGVLTAQNNGTVTGCHVFGGKFDAKTPVEIKLTDNVTVFGGLVGTNTGTVTDSSATVNITHSGSASEVTIGGLVGRMDGGQINGSSTSGQITKSSLSKASSFIAGGVVGCENDDASEKTYTNVKSTVYVSDSIASSGNTANGNTTAGKGKVGTFVGYVHNGHFTNCSTTDAEGTKNKNRTFHFLGEVNVVSTMTIDSSYYKSTEKYDTPVEIPESSKEEYDAALAEKGLTALTTEEKVYKYDAVLTGCTFELSDTTKKQEINSGANYYSADVSENTKFDGEYLKQTKETKTEYPSYTNRVDYEDVATRGSSGNNPNKSNYYVKVGDDYYPLYGWRESGWRTYYYLGYYNDSGELTQIGNRTTDGGSRINGNNGTALYTRTEEIVTTNPEVTANDNGYIIVTSDGRYALGVNANGNAVAQQIKNGDLSTAPRWMMKTVTQQSGWNKTEIDTWVSTHNSNYKLRLYYSSSWLGGTTIKVIDTNDTGITVTFKNNGSDGNGLFTFNSNSGYLTFNNGNFSVNNNNNAGQFKLYKVSDSTKTYVGTFTIDGSLSGQVLGIS